MAHHQTFHQVPKQAWQFPSWVGPEYNLSDTKWLQPPQLQEALRSYMGNIAFTDNQLGKIMKVLDEIDYTQNSLILFTGDHGQNIGEHNTWTKMTAWEHSLRVPLIIAAPWLTETHGKIHTGMAEMCDFYRTLSDLAGIAPSAVDKGVECDGLAAAFNNPASAGKRYAFSQTQRVSIPSLRTERQATPGNPYAHLPAAADLFYAPSCFSYNHQIEWMIFTVRSSEWRLTMSLQWDGVKLCPHKPTTPEAMLAMTELYDHRGDTAMFDLDVAEYKNVAAENAAVVAQMRAALETYVVYC